MSQIEKTVFISYRRTNIGFALAVYQHLKHHNFDIFLDYTGINAGDFEQIIIENIKSRAHFIVILTSSALERCNEPGDWLRREIETAIDMKRNIVPLTFEGFDWGLAREKYLTGKLAVLSNYNALRIPMDYFDEGMEKLRLRYLSIPLDMVLHPAGKQAEKMAEIQQKQADSAPVVQEKTLTAEEWFEEANQSSDFAEKVRLYSEAIRRKPDFAIAYNNRGIAKGKLSDNTGAIADFNEAIRLNPDDAIAYNNRGTAKLHFGDYDGAINNYNESIRLNPDFADGYSNRGEAHFALGQYDNAHADFQKAMQLNPIAAHVIGGLAVASYKLGKLQQATNLWKMLCGLDAQYRDADWTADTLNWSDALREEAKKLVAKL
jgi:tetratricopeptide (TPR) repeat protein